MAINRAVDRSAMGAAQAQLARVDSEGCVDHPYRRTLLSAAGPAANRDLACCPEPDRLDITRPVGRVATFGAGIHYCLGAPLARLEGQIGLNALLQRLPDLALATEELAWQRTVAVRCPITLPVIF